MTVILLYYLPRIDLVKYNVIIDGRNFYDNPTESDLVKYNIIDGRNFYDNPIESDIEKYRELKKVMIGK